MQGEEDAAGPAPGAAASEDGRENSANSSTDEAIAEADRILAEARAAEARAEQHKAAERAAFDRNYPRTDAAELVLHQQPAGTTASLGGGAAAANSATGGDARLDADRAEIAAFVEAMFARADDGTFVSLRSFVENDAAAKPIDVKAVALDGTGLAKLTERAFSRAGYAARYARPAVFSPPVATFNSARHAREIDLANGLALSVEIDADPTAGLTLLRGLLGPPTVVVASGGSWTDPTSGDVQPRLHGHWRLCEPTRTTEEHGKLKRARHLATALVGGDPCGVPTVHPFRWPGSVHRKAGAKLCHAVELGEAEIDLAEALDALEAAATARGINIDGTGPSGGNGNDRETADLIGSILAGGPYTPSLVALSARYAGGGMTRPKIVATLQGMMRAVPEAIRDGGQPGRWQARFDAIARIAETAVEKYGPDAAATEHGAKIMEALLGEAQAKTEEQKKTEEQEKAEEQKQILDYLEQFNSKLLVGTAPPIKWLIEGSYRLGELGVFAAIGAAGKSMLLLALALEIIQDKKGSLYRNPLLGGEVVATGSVVIFCAEDNRDEIWRRLEQLDPEGKIRLNAPHTLYVITVPDLDFAVYIVRAKGREMALDGGLQFIESIVLNIPDLALGVIDPIQPFCCADLNQSADAVQISFNALSRLAARSKAAIILTHHMRKSGKEITSPEEARESIRGSGDIVNRPRLSYALWPAGKEDITKVGRALGIPTPRNSVFFGAVVKANGVCNNEVQTYVRDNDSGLLIDRTAALDALRRADADLLFDALVQGIADAVSAGRPFMRTGQAGLYARRSELPGCLQYLGNERLPKMADKLLQDGRIVLVIAGGTTPKWLDLPDGPFARGEGIFEAGAPTGRAGAKKKPEASAPTGRAGRRPGAKKKPEAAAPTGRAGRRPGAKKKPAAGGRRQRAKKEPT